MMFFVGLHQPSDARHFDRAFVSINRLVGRHSHFEVNDWIMDSGAFSEISEHGRYRSSVEIYAQRIWRWSHVGNMLAAVSQDYMCEPHIIERTGMSIREYIDSYQGGRGVIRSMEGMIQQITSDCASILGVRVDVRASLLINPNQEMILDCAAY